MATRTTRPKRSMDALKAEKKEELTEQEKLNNQIMATLAQLGGERAAAEEVQYAKGFTVPELYRGNLEGAADRLKEIHRDLESEQLFVKNYPFKIWDVSAAITRVFRTVFGVSVVQKSTFFNPSGFREVPVSVTETITVPFGNIAMPTFSGPDGPGTLGLSQDRDDQGFLITQMFIECPKKFEGAVQGFWRMVEEELEKRSIYKGKSIDSSDMPQFLDLRQIDRDKIIFNNITFRQLQANLWTPIMYPEFCRQAGIAPKRAVLLQGTFGTGKTLAAMWTAKVCEELKRTFIMCNPKDNNVFECLKLAAQYQPACLFVEDIDTIAGTDNRNAMARLLDEFDGLRAKGLDLIMVMTTNQVGEIAKGMLRPGRLDAVIEIANLDLEGTTRLIKSIFRPEELVEDLDYVAIHEAMEGFTPAFIKEVGQKVLLYSIERIAQGEPQVYHTEDFLAAVKEMRTHYNLHLGGKDQKPAATIDRGFSEAVERILDGLPIHRGGEEFMKIVVPNNSPR